MSKVIKDGYLYLSKLPICAKDGDLTLLFASDIVVNLNKKKFLKNRFNIIADICPCKCSVEKLIERYTK